MAASSPAPSTKPLPYAPHPKEEIPPLSEYATPDEKELHWFKHVYQGDTMPQLTVRAVVMGGILGMFMSISNLYTTLQLGWSFGVAITACVMSYVIWNLLRALSGGKVSQMSILENNCMQSTASAAGYSTGATVGVAFGALLLITRQHVPWYYMMPITFLTASLGVFLAVPMKRQMINIEKLPFPTGIATAETLRSLYSHGAVALRKAYSLLTAMFVGAVVGVLNRAEGMLGWLDRLRGSVHLPELLQIPNRWLSGLGLPGSGGMANFGFEPSVLLIGAGMIVGMRVSLSMLLGSVLLHFVAVPLLVRHDPTFLTKTVTAFNPATGDFNAIKWALWGGSSMLVFASLISVALQWRVLARSFAGLGGGRSPDLAAMDRIETPNHWLLIGIIPIGIGMVIMAKIAFDITPWLGAIAVALSFVIALVCCRVTGETDTTPMGAMGKVTQLLYGMLAPGNVTANLMTAGITSGAGSSAADLLTDLKSGYLLGANPRKQFIAQFCGVFFGTLAIVPAWYLMVPDADSLEKNFKLPATNIWKAVAQMLTKGFGELSTTQLWAIVIGGMIGLILPLIHHLFPKVRPYMPSVTGLGFSWVMYFNATLAFAIGAVIAWLWEKANKKSAETYVVPVASGFVAGESLIAALLAICVALPSAYHSFMAKIGQG